MKSTKYQVAIIGAGHLGMRHLEGLVKSKYPMSIHIVDPSEDSRHAVEKFKQLTASYLPPIQAYKTVNTLPNKLDLVIIATTASRRLEVLEQLCKTSKVHYLILEKFLFNDSKEYADAASLIEQNKISAWVNTPRRNFDIYRALREQMASDQLLQAVIDGGDWGLCCNSVHFIDLVQFLSGDINVELIEASFDANVLKSKRDTYLELTGELTGKVGNTRWTIRSVCESQKPVTISLYYKKQTIVIAEGIGKLWRFNRGQVDAADFRVPYQSEMTGSIADKLISSGDCDLPAYQESVAAHIPLLHSFAKFAGNVDGSRSHCAIT